MSEPKEIILSPAERFVHLSSEFATNASNDTSNCVFQFSSPIASPSDQYVMSIGVHNASIPHTWYNISGRNWNLFLGYLGVGFITGSIPDQNYTGTSYAAALQASIRAAQAAAGLSQTFVVTYNTETNFFFLSNSIIASTPAWYFAPISNSIYYDLGFRDLYYNRANAAVSALNTAGTLYALTPPAQCDLSGYHSVYMNVIGYSTNSICSYAGLAPTAVIARIPVRMPFTAIESFEPDNIEYTPLPGVSFSNIQITLVGDDGIPLDLHGADWTATLHIKFAALRAPEAASAMLTPQNIMSTQVYGGRRVF
jgi:hypothetical protein